MARRHRWARRYTLVGVTADRSGSVQDFAREMEKALKEIVSACRKSPRADNLLLRLTRFDHQIEEIHGFRQLADCTTDAYDGILQAWWAEARRRLEASGCTFVRYGRITNMIDIADHPDPAHDPANVAIVLVEDDDPDDFDIDVDDEAVAARTEFSWTVKFTVSGTWVADGFDLDHERAMTMLRSDLAYAHEHEVSAQVLEAPPPAAIQAMQGERGPEADAGQSLLDGLLAAEVTRLRAARDRGETGAEDAS